MIFECLVVLFIFTYKLVKYKKCWRSICVAGLLFSLQCYSVTVSTMLASLEHLMTLFMVLHMHRENLCKRNAMNALFLNNWRQLCCCPLLCNKVLKDSPGQCGPYPHYNTTQSFFHLNGASLSAQVKYKQMHSPSGSPVHEMTWPQQHRRLF